MCKIANQANIDCTLNRRHQPKDKVCQAFAVVCVFSHPNGALLTNLYAHKQFPYLYHFKNDWVVNYFFHWFCKDWVYDKILAAAEELKPELDIEMDVS